MELHDDLVEEPLGGQDGTTRSRAAQEKEEGRMKLGATDIVSVQARPPKERAQPVSDEEN